MLNLLDRTAPEGLITQGDVQRIQAIAARCLVQSEYHQRNLQVLMKLILLALDEEFSESGPLDLKAFASEALEAAYEEIYPALCRPAPEENS